MLIRARNVSKKKILAINNKNMYKILEFCCGPEAQEIIVSNLNFLENYFFVSLSLLNKGDIAL